MNFLSHIPLSRLFGRWKPAWRGLGTAMPAAVLLWAAQASAQTQFLGGADQVMQGNKATVPVYFTYFGGPALSELAFTLRYPEDDGVTLASLGAHAGFTVSVLDSSASGRRDLLLEPTGSAPGNDIFEVLRLEFALESGASGDFAVTFESALANGSQTVTTRSISVSSEWSSIALRADYNSDKVIDMQDAADYLNRLLLPGNSYLVDFSDYTGYDSPSAEDVSVLTRFASGRQDTIPQSISWEPRPSEGNVTLQLGLPEALGSNVYAYPVRATGSSLEFESAEFRFDLDPSIVSSILQLEGDGTETFAGGRLNPGGQYEAFLSYGTVQRSAVIARIYVVHRSGETGTGLALASAFLSEGKYTGNFSSEPNRRQDVAVTIILPRNSMEGASPRYTDPLGRARHGISRPERDILLRVPPKAQRRLR